MFRRLTENTKVKMALVMEYTATYVFVIIMLVLIDAKCLSFCKTIFRVISENIIVKEKPIHTSHYVLHVLLLLIEQKAKPRSEHPHINLNSQVSAPSPPPLHNRVKEDGIPFKIFSKRLNIM